MDAVTELENKRQEFLNNADALLLAINILKGNSAVSPTLVVGDSLALPPLPETNGEDWKNGRVIDRVLGIIKLHGRFMYRKEIEDYAENNGKGFTGVIASTMSDAQATEDIIMINDGGNRVWGLKSWVYNGSIVPKYNYVKNEKYYK